MWRFAGLAVCGVVLSSGTAQQAKPQQAPPKPEYTEPQRMPMDRAEDSYAIYSQLLPGNQIEWGNVPRTQWLIEDATKATPLGTECAKGGMINPHEGITAPADKQADFAEVLADFDTHCHDRYWLDAGKFSVKLPVRIMSEQDQKQFVGSVMHYMPPSNDIMRAPKTPDAFQGAAGMHSFSAVYFNHAHNLAMTQIGMYCGGLCGNWSWVVLGKRGATWRVLPWVHSFAIS